MRSYTLIMTICIALMLFLDADCQYMTNPDRTDSVNSLCSSFQGRDQLVTEEVIAKNQQYQAAMQAEFGDGNQIIKSAFKGDITALTSDQFISKITIYVGAFFVALVILLFMFCFLFCCCTCPGCCPSSCCRKPEGQAYTKCELLWPAFTLLACFLVLLIGGAIGVAESGNLQASLKSTGCALAITLDDFINGNVTTSGEYFIGLRTLTTQLQNLNSQLPNINSRFNQVKTTGTYGTAITSDKSSLDTAMAAIDDNIPGAGIAYSTPFIDLSSTGGNAAGATTPVYSDMPSQLGDTSTSSTTLYASQTALDSIQTGIQAITDNIGDFQSGISTFSDALDSMIDRTDQLATTIQDADSSFGSAYQSIYPTLEMITAVITAIFAVLIAFSIFGALGTILIAFGKFYKCRYLIYFICFILFFAAIAFLLVASIMSIINPLIYFSCDFLQNSISSVDSFQSNFQGIVDDETAEYITVCLPGASGDLLSTIGGSATGDLNKLNQAMEDMNDFDNNEIQDNIEDAYQPVLDLLQKYYYGWQLDFTDTSGTQGVDSLQILADPGSYSATRYSACSSISDSWVPTAKRDSSPEIACSSSSLAKTDTCTVSSCSGCIGIQEVFQTDYYVGGGTILTDFDTKYGNCQFKTDMDDASTYYFQVKYDQYMAAGKPLNQALSVQTTQLASYITNVKALGTQFDSILNDLGNTISSITDTQYGLLAGFNCLIFGEDLNLFINTFCSYFSNTIFYLRVAAGMSGITIMFAMCCTVCTGVRHYKQGLLPEHDIQDDKKQVHPNDLNKTEEGMINNNNIYYQNNNQGMYQLSKMT